MRVIPTIMAKQVRGFSRITLQNINQKVVKSEYAVRGEVVIRACEIEEEMKAGKKFPFDKLLYCNVGNPQCMKQKPMTFLREVLALTSWPELMTKCPEQFHSDAIERAKELIAANPGGSGAYSHSMGVQEICKHVANYITERDGYKADYTQIFLTNGASQAVQDTLKLLINGPKDAILVPIPQYPLYSASITIDGGQMIGYYLDEKNDWGLDMNKVQESLNKAKQQGLEVKALAAVNPGNPTGKCFSRKNIEDIVRLCAKEQICILADEVYQPNIYRPGDKFESFRKVILDLGEEAKNVQLVSFHSTSKGFFGECGRRGGYLELHNFDQAVKDQLYKLVSICCCSNVDGQYTVDVMVNPPKPGQPSYPLWEKEKNEIMSSLKRRADKLTSGLDKLEGVHCQSTDGALYTYFSITMPPKAIEAAKKKGCSPDHLYCMELLNQAGVVCVGGSGFGQEEGTFHVRSTILPPEDEVDQVIERMKKFHNEFLARYK